MATNTPRLFVAAASESEGFRRTVTVALAHLGSGDRRVTKQAAVVSAAEHSWPDTFATLAARANAFLDEAVPAAEIELVLAPRIDELTGELGRRLTARESTDDGPKPWTDADTVLFLIDARTAAPGDDVNARLEAALHSLDRLQQKTGLGLSPYSVLVYDDHDESAVYSHAGCTARKTPDEAWVLAVDAIRAFADLVQLRHANARAVLPQTEVPATLATALTDFLTDESGEKWGLHFFTGSIVSKVIQDATTIARRAGNPVLRGPSEHSLACGALARWQLREAPFLMVMTAGMVDELRGTLANLRDSQARGFIVIGETEPGQWQPFQGTVHDHEDARAVFAARRVPCIHLTDPARISQDLQAAFRAYHQRSGPVVLLASPTVLAHAGGVELPKPTSGVARPQVCEDTVDAIARIVNTEQSVLVWQCGHLAEPERELVHRLARLAGIALTDSLGRPGTVARFHRGKAVKEYLGTLSLYGSSPAVWRLLHPSGKSLGYDEHAIFFLKSRIPDLATPFSEKALFTRLRVVQVTDTPRHIAPFTDLPVVEDLHSFLVRLSRRVAPDAEVVRFRREAIAAALSAPPDPLRDVPTMPMTHEYFFTQLNGVLENLIQHNGYRYTGFYDVGRGGVSAVRNLSRTGEGLSGWYGRALMGDALLGIPALALSEQGNILAFIGDGAAALVPSFLPSLAQQLRYESGRVDGNVTIFTLLNGGFSIIRSYRELQHATTADAQMSLLTQVEGGWKQQWGGTTVTHERLTTMNAERMKERLLAPATVNLVSVYLAHENEGDSVMPASRKNWRMP
ncbi:hypothetical protein CU254_12840 [Amycolatopsis sp. AA4]|uniref:hypothetical protein n=1 Tax=Actinomycetes TaxID=1760 RepID=UPI0001B5657D|nr:MULTISPECIES: hypothetical protein [Actinomycetes]ATY11253.1 hypothetical protein CU254_12840 [Amycolatopsis sp. AA4]EFL06843.1 predicted protein [Streptomyces sp. AA4]